MPARQSSTGFSVEGVPDNSPNRSHGLEVIRILQVVTVMDRGGIETWLMHLLRNIDRKRFVMDFLTQTTREGEFDKEIRALGSNIFPCLYPNRPWLYAGAMRKVLATRAPYHVIHSHLNHYNGIVLRLASRAGIPVRIAHSHTDTSTIDTAANWPRKAYLKISRRWISRFASIELAASKRASVSLFGKQHNHHPRYILPCGVELAPFGLASDSAAVRAELGIPKDREVIGHVGRFVDSKNHTVLVQIAAGIVSRNANTHFLLVGDGPLRGCVEQQVARLNLSSHFTFLGIRGDVPRLMSGAMDVFVFPSRLEGLGLVLVEAQAAGLHCFYSDCVPEEADLVAALVHRVPMGQDATAWAELVLNWLETRGGPVDRRAALQTVQRSAFNIENSLCRIQELYERSLIS